MTKDNNALAVGLVGGLVLGILLSIGLATYFDRAPKKAPSSQISQDDLSEPTIPRALKSLKKKSQKCSELSGDKQKLECIIGLVEEQVQAIDE